MACDLPRSEWRLSVARIAAFSEFYLPGFAGGGTIVSLSRIVEEEPEHDVRVITNDHDLGATSSYPDIRHHTWLPVGRGSVAYLRLGFNDASWVIRELRRWRPDAYYVNSLQCPEYSLTPFLLRRVGILPKGRLIVAPRGECGEAAQAHKGLKKRLARPLIRWLVGPGVVWQASSESEADDIRRWYGKELPSADRIIVRGDPPPRPAAISTGSQSVVPVVVFASRIDQMKGLDLALGVISRVSHPCVFRVAGSVSDPVYWERCRKLAEDLPPHISFEYCGPYTPDLTAEILSAADFLLLPTRGENFGHAIAEALSVGCPVVISDRTIWTDLVNSSGGSAGDLQENLDFLQSSLTEDVEKRLARRRSILDGYSTWFTSQVGTGSFFSEALE